MSDPFFCRAGVECLREDLAQRAKLRQLAQTAPDALERGGDEVEVVKAAALEGLPGEGAEDLDGALEKGLEVAPAQALPGLDPPAVVLDQLQFRGLAENAGHAAISE